MISPDVTRSMVNWISSVSRKKFQPPHACSTRRENRKPVPDTAQLLPSAMRAPFR